MYRFWVFYVSFLLSDSKDSHLDGMMQSLRVCAFAVLQFHTRNQLLTDQLGEITNRIHLNVDLYSSWLELRLKNLIAFFAHVSFKGSFSFICGRVILQVG